MKRILFTILFCCALSSIGAQEVGLKQQKGSSMFLSFNNSIGVMKYIDKGVSPLIYKGPAATTGLGFSVAFKRIRIKAQTDILGSLPKKEMKTVLPNTDATYTSTYKAYGSGCDLYAQFLFRFYDNYGQRLRLFIGSGIQNILDVKYNENYMNAAIGLTDFLNINVAFLAEYDFNFDALQPHIQRERWPFTASFEFILPAGTAMLRPGFTYVSNGTGNTGSYILIFKALCGAQSDLGLMYHFKNENCIKLSYHWTYLTTSQSSYDRFDEAYHLAFLSFLFKLK